MADGIQIDLKNADTVKNLIRIRNRELGQTTKQSASALVINILQSLKANTRTANEKKLNIEISEATSQYRPSFSRTQNKRVFRGSGNHHVEPPKDWIVVYARDYKHTKSYHVIDKDVGKNYLVVCETSAQAKEIIKTRHMTRVKQYKGLAKTALGIASAHIAQKSGYSEITNPKVRKSALGNIEVEVSDNGYDSGDVSIHVKDGLDYAADALRGGKSYVNTAVQKAMNKMAGQLMHTLKPKGKLTDSLKVELESLIDKGEGK